jgi:porin
MRLSFMRTSFAAIGLLLWVTLAASPAFGQSAAPQEPAPPPPPTDLLHRETLTGDWDGARTRWKDKGVVFESALTQFYQGVASGGVETGDEYNAKAEAGLKFDFGKLAGWQFWSAEIKAEWRFGDPMLGGVGTINPVNTAAMVPAADGSVFSITALNVTKLFPVNLQEGKLVALSFGRYNILDLIDEDFFAGSGLTRFMNIAPIGPLTVLRQVPLITNGISFAYIKGGQPFITFALLDPNDHSLDPGLDDLFADGVTFSPAINFVSKHGDKTAKHTFGFAVTTKEYTPFDAIRQVIIPGPPLNPIEPQAGSWSVNYEFRQYLVERGPRDGWGLFTQLSAADQDTSPITAFVNIGLGGNGVIASRPRDEFGVSYAYTDLSEELKDNLAVLPHGGRLRAEHQLEVFYNMHVTPWLQLTGDLQFIRPNRRIADSAFVPGVRLRVEF